MSRNIMLSMFGQLSLGRRKYTAKQQKKAVAVVILHHFWGWICLLTLASKE